MAKELPDAPGHVLRRCVPWLGDKGDATRDKFRELAGLFEKHALKNPEYEWPVDEKMVLRAQHFGMAPIMMCCRWPLGCCLL